MATIFTASSKQILGLTQGIGVENLASNPQAPWNNGLILGVGLQSGNQFPA